MQTTNDSVNPKLKSNDLNKSKSRREKKRLSSFSLDLDQESCVIFNCASERIDLCFSLNLGS